MSPKKPDSAMVPDEFVGVDGTRSGREWGGTPRSILCLPPLVVVCVYDVVGSLTTRITVRLELKTPLSLFLLGFLETVLTPCLQ